MGTISKNGFAKPFFLYVRDSGTPLCIGGRTPPNGAETRIFWGFFGGFAERPIGAFLEKSDVFLVAFVKISPFGEFFHKSARRGLAGVF